MTEPAPLIPEQRHQAILELLRIEQVVSIRRVTDHLRVSQMTVRRDIAQLEDAGLVTPVAGGVRLGGSRGHLPPTERRDRAPLELPRKRAIARAAADLVRDGMVLYLDAGTTCEAVIPLIGMRAGLTVVTSDFFIAVRLLEHPRVQTIHTGGLLDASSGSSGGPFATRTVRSIHLDLCLLSTGSWDLDRGLTTHSLDKVDLKTAAAESSDRKVLLADSTKHGAASRYLVLPLDLLDGVITDDGLDVEARRELRAAGVRLTIAVTT